MTDTIKNFDALQEELGITFPTIEKARQQATRKISELHDLVVEHTTDDTSVVVFGSLARREFTSGSDVDYTLLIDGQANRAHWDAALNIKDAIEQTEKSYGREGTFGGTASSYDLIHKIGGDDDTNRNTTQRILLLLESTPLGRADAHRRVRRAILDRYIHEDHGWVYSSNPLGVPRFLQNDIARYWRTVAVDFAYKRRDRGGKGWALRTAKLRLSRKLTYAAGLVACFQCSELQAGNGDVDQGAGRRGVKMVEALEGILVHTPLEILGSAYLRFQKLDAARRLFEAYDGFLAMLDDEESREHLDTLTQERVMNDPRFQHVRELGHVFQDALNELFFPEDARGGYYPLTRTYGVF
jgi:predicted nucleotidyltransferase